MKNTGRTQGKEKKGRVVPIREDYSRTIQACDVKDWGRKSSSSLHIPHIPLKRLRNMPNLGWKEWSGKFPLSKKTIITEIGLVLDPLVS